MSVSPDKKIFKCFSCGAGGNVISFVQNHEGISFIEAVKKLSDKYDIN
jgi:DNA primase